MIRAEDIEAAGNLATITLTILPRTKLLASTKAIVMADVFPLHAETLS